MPKEAGLAAEGTPPLLYCILFPVPHLGMGPDPKAGPRPGEQCLRVPLGGGEVGRMRWDKHASQAGERDPRKASHPVIKQEPGVSQRPWVGGGWGCWEAWERKASRRRDHLDWGQKVFHGRRELDGIKGGSSRG